MVMTGRCRTVCALLCVGLLVGCDGRAALEPTPNPVPIVQGTMPALLTVSSEGAEATILGIGFVEGAAAYWNGDPRPTEFVDGSQLIVSLSAADLELVGSGDVRVENPPPGGGMSDAVGVTVGHGSPTAESVSPTMIEVLGDITTTLSVVGSGFAQGPDGAEARWNGIPLPTMVESSTRLTSSIPDYLLRKGGPVEIRVHNPAPGGGLSNGVAFETRNPVPTLTRLSPAGVRVGEGREIVLDGLGFVAGTRVGYGSDRLLPEFLSATALSIAAPAERSVRGDTISVRVETPAPGGGTSGVLRLPVWERPPTLARLSKRWATQDDPPFTLMLIGSDFAPDAATTWNGEPRAPTFVDGTRLDLQVTSDDLAAVGDVEIVVVNPREGGPSEALDFSIIPPFQPSDHLVLTEAYGAQELRVSRLDGTELQSWSFPDFASRPDVHPGGGTVAFHRSVGEDLDRAIRIFVADLADGVARRLLDPAYDEVLEDEFWPRFSGNGEWIYFTAVERAGPRTRAWRARTDGSEAGPVFESMEDRQQWDPSPANGDDRIVFSDEDQLLKVFDPSTLAVRSLGVRGQRSRWSPDDEWIAFEMEGRLRIVRADGSEILDPAPEAVFGPAFDWLPDGEHIVATTPTGDGVLLSVPLGKVDPLPGLGQIATITPYPES